MTDEEQRNESYPAAPRVGWQPSDAEVAARRAFIDRRNATEPRGQ